MWNLPRPGIEPVSLAQADGLLTIGPPGKSSRTFSSSQTETLYPLNSNSPFSPPWIFFCANYTIFWHPHHQSNKIFLTHVHFYILTRVIWPFSEKYQINKWGRLAVMKKVPKEDCHQLESALGDHPDLPRTEGVWGAGFCFKTRLGPTKSLHPI